MGQLRRHTIAAAACAAVILVASAASAQTVDIELPGKFGEFRVVNRGTAIRLNSAVKVQRKVGSGWEDAEVSNLYLIPACQANAVPGCVSLAAKASLQPVAWRGNYCSAQCMSNCNLDGPVPPGTYRYVVTSCDHKHQFVSAAFEKKAEEPKH
jgi:hypothetical protein